MGRRPLLFRQKPVVLKKASSQPDFTAATVLVPDPWDYVDLWLRREKLPDARFYWEQARQFYNAAQLLPPTAAPLPAYYCMLNATKALLEAKGVKYAPHHGVSHKDVPKKRGLRATLVKFQGSGVLPALIAYLGEDATVKEVSLYDLLYNLPCIHRAFTVTYTSAKELFIPVMKPRFIVTSESNEVWFEMTLEPSATSGHTLGKLPEGYEHDEGVADACVVRRKKRFKWTFTKAAERENLTRLCKYHHEVRKVVFYIYGSTRLWYLKRKADGASDYVEHTGPVLMFAAMHRLSEYSRYEPLALMKHLEQQQNWLLTEFIRVAPTQFIDEIAAEITGRDFMIPGIRK